MMRLSVPALALALAAVLAPHDTLAQRAQIPTIAQDPYLGAMVVDASNGKVLFEKNADATCFPASMVKLMDLLVILEDVQRGTVKLTDPITATAESSKMGGSQVYLREHESFPLDDLLYAVMVQSANDAATAIAIGLTGSKDAFVKRMNQRAQELGMQSTQFHSVHGLPPGQGQEPDKTTPRDLILLARELLKHPETLRYTSTVKRGFRNDTFTMENHNNLLGSGGCDGLKTGYFRAAGYSIVATAGKDGRRVIAAVVGSTSKGARDQATAQLLAEGLAAASAPPPPPPPKPVVTNALPEIAPPPPPPEESTGWGWKTWLGIAVGVGLIAYGIFRRRKLEQDF
ncbi:MAG: D-alanyl-D-alanine carboxypeptidase [Lentisphaerae bacterium]|nr:D-alanyl-D-alanine carboxypeptidase [Lentisphaerota bacterium]